MLSAFKSVAVRALIQGNGRVKIVSSVPLRGMASGHSHEVEHPELVNRKIPTKQERMEQWDYVNSIYYGPERDTKNFPIIAQRDRPAAVRLGLFPAEWFDLLYPKTGVSGPYVFLGGLSLWMLSKEVMVMDHYFWQIPSLTILIYILIKHPSVGPKLKEWCLKNNQDADEKFFIRPINRWREKENVEITKNQRLIEETETAKHMFQAQKEGVELQLEAVYRQRLQNAFHEVKKRLDYEVEKVSTKRKFEQEHMVNWIVSNVTKSITAQQEKESIKTCIDSLKRLAAKSAVA